MVATVPSATTPVAVLQNTAVALARLGRPVRFVTAYADDEHGRLLAAHLGDNAVTPGSDPFVLERTATATATLAESGAATYEFDIDWRFNLPDLPDDVVPVVVVFGSIAAAIEPGAPLVAAPGRAGTGRRR
ncbi:hypothetical protein [Nocardioides sp. B-3]|uniref:hypothetical protein n=1 Tax=Nocardioides sp. B-3 TaxID=2895565 RepID=UPI0021533920|nr:hypothetical protein [Nocardioides sp. B-3]UUZ57875.1 hypothetical protein LP418_15995 [Nocardioides sp. B-3]